jgi:hypothetical protein
VLGRKLMRGVCVQGEDARVRRLAGPVVAGTRAANYLVLVTSNVRSRPTSRGDVVLNEFRHVARVDGAERAR